ncbi:hypothetical protein SAMN05192534_103136 [Alteribacillus persepolensis]|uniref:Uncharacterized protein n=1 Tax=Alteribacillus persepolensis TaxID=568899 RepID=A0A1G8B3M7_9BACI|nr:hypothetical protein SAMN05192534_103136 [Alteribacillus persepolensis]
MKKLFRSVLTYVMESQQERVKRMMEKDQFF